MLVTTGGLVASARTAGAGLGAFNVITLEHAEAIAAAAARVDRPAVLAISENAVRYHGGDPVPLVSACAAIARASDATLAVHLDHIVDEELALRTAEAGASSLMFDASRSDDAANIERTARMAAAAHAAGLWIEAELGQVGGKAGQPALGAHDPGARTDPADAAAFVAATGVDALAVAVGSSHAMVERTAVLDLDLIAALASAVGVPLVLHGSSGVPDDQLAAAVVAGMTKINVGTLLNTSFTAEVRRQLAEHPDNVDPRRYLAPAREALERTVAAMLLVLHP